MAPFGVSGSLHPQPGWAPGRTPARTGGMLPVRTPLKSFCAHNYGVNSVAISPDGSTLASGGGDQIVKLWSLPGGVLLRTLTVGTDMTAGVSAVAISPNGQLLACQSYNETIQLWSFPAGALLSTLITGSSNNQHVYTLAISPDGRLLASGSQD